MNAGDLRSALRRAAVLAAEGLRHELVPYLAEASGYVSSARSDEVRSPPASMVFPVMLALAILRVGIGRRAAAADHYHESVLREAAELCAKLYPDTAAASARQALETVTSGIRTVRC